jgi:hypothetical protein
MKSYVGSIALLMAAIGVAIGGYSINLRVSAERQAVTRLHAELAADARDIRMLQAELRTRARLPELQRWNDEVFPQLSAQGVAMTAPQAAQFLRSPVQLASYVQGAPTVPAAPRASLAIAPPAPVAAPAPMVVQTAYHARSDEAAPARPGLIRVAARAPLGGAGLEAALGHAITTPLVAATGGR